MEMRGENLAGKELSQQKAKGDYDPGIINVVNEGSA
jgi:hypothetical protein